MYSFKKNSSYIMELSDKIYKKEKQMKKVIALILALTMCFALCACGEQASPAYKLGDKVATDVMEITLDRAQLALALGNSGSTNNFDNYGTPKEYDASADGSNPFIAAKGHCLVYASFTVTNLDRNSIDIGGDINPQLTSVEYNGETYADNLQFTGEFKAEDVHWMPHSAINAIIDAGATISLRGYIDIAVEPENLNDTFRLTFLLPNSAGETEEFTYEITEADISVGADREQAAIDAKTAAQEAELKERMTPADEETTALVKQYVTYDSLQYSDYSTGAEFTHLLEFGDDSVTVTSTSMGMSVVKNGTYTVCTNDIFIDFEDESFIDCFVPFTVENGEVSLYAMENIA